MRYILARFVQGVFVLFGVSLITFFLPALFKASPSEIAVSVLGTSRVSPRAYTAWIHQHGLDRPLIEQYWTWLTGALHGNFGIAYKESSQYHTVGVGTVLGANLGRSVWLRVPPTVVATLVAVPIGLTQAVRRNKAYDHTMTTFVY